jgi:hypothetical protein
MDPAMYSSFSNWRDYNSNIGCFTLRFTTLEAIVQFRSVTRPNFIFEWTLQDDFVKEPQIGYSDRKGSNLEKKNQLLKVAPFKNVNWGMVVQRREGNRRWRTERVERRERQRGGMKERGSERKQGRRDIKSF